MTAAAVKNTRQRDLSAACVITRAGKHAQAGRVSISGGTHETKWRRNDASVQRSSHHRSAARRCGEGARVSGRVGGRPGSEKRWGPKRATRGGMRWAPCAPAGRAARHKPQPSVQTTYRRGWPTGLCAADRAAARPLPQRAEHAPPAWRYATAQRSTTRTGGVLWSGPPAGGTTARSRGRGAPRRGHRSCTPACLDDVDGARGRTGDRLDSACNEASCTPSRCMRYTLLASLHRLDRS